MACAARLPPDQRWTLETTLQQEVLYPDLVGHSQLLSLNLSPAVTAMMDVDRVSRHTRGLEMSEILSVDGAAASPLSRSSMQEMGFQETLHLESWLKAHPQAIGEDLIIVTTQFDAWESQLGSARERPDILALSSSGQVVVVELKKGGDRRIHLQAITYGALAASFTIEELGKAHAKWLRTENGEVVSTEGAVERLREHVDGEWNDALLELPRLVVVAESFPPQVLTTVQWLERVAPDLTIECHEYSLFRTSPDACCLSIVHGRSPSSHGWPAGAVADTGGLQPDFPDRGPFGSRKSVTIIHEHKLIPDGAVMNLSLAGHVRRELAEPVEEWLSQDDARRDVRWVDDPARPLLWAAWDVDPTRRWTPSSLRNQIFQQAIGETPSFSAADAWSYQGRSLHQIADSASAGES